MKVAIVNFIYKGKSKLEVTIDKTVSVLPILSKVMKKLMFDRLVTILEKS